MDGVTGEDVFCIGADPSDPRRFVFLPLDAKRRHMVITGQTGSGKSTYALDQIMGDVVAGRSCLVCDPKGDLVRDVVAALAMTPEETWPRLARDVVIVDPADPDCPASFNPFEITPYGTPARQRQDVYSTMRQVFRLDESAARMALVMRRTVQLAIEHELTICDVPRILSDAEFRDRLVQRAADLELRRFWEAEFPQGPQAQLVWAAPTLTRVELLIDDPNVRRFLGQRRGSFDFRSVMDANGLCLLSLGQGSLGIETSHLLGGFLLGRIQLAAESRVNLPAHLRRLCVCYLDEAQQYATNSLEEMLAMARGYAVSLVLIHQHLEQLPRSLQRALFGNAGVRVAFRLSAEDAAVYQRECHTPSGDVVTETRLKFAQIGPLPIPYREPKFASVAEEGRLLREALRHLPDREMLVHLMGERTPWRLRSIDVPLAELRDAHDRVARFKRVLYDAQRRAQPETEAAPAPARAAPFEWAGVASEDAER